LVNDKDGLFCPETTPERPFLSLKIPQQKGKKKRYSQGEYSKGDGDHSLE
jgi:hypothetical protein